MICAAGVGALSSLGASGCGGGQTRAGAAFSPDWFEDGGKTIRALQPRIEAAQVQPNADVAVGVVDDGLVGVSLADGNRWSYPHVIDSRPAAAGDVVVGMGGGEVFALKATSGERLWSRPAVGALRGIGDDGRTTVLSIAKPGRGTILLAVDRAGAVVRQVEAGPAVGVPAVRGGYAFLPWQNHYVTVYDLTSGSEVARLFIGERVSHAFLSGQALFFGETSLVRFDARLVAGAPVQPTIYPPLSRTLPGDPVWMPPGYDALAPVADARDKVSLFAYPAKGTSAGVDSDRFMALYFSYALGFDARTRNLAWVHTHSTDILTASAFSRGVALCDADGKITLLDAKTGITGRTVEFGKPVKSCVLQTDELAGVHTSRLALPLLEQLSVALKDPRGEFVTLKEVLVDEVAKQPDSQATKLLVDVLTDARTPEPLFARAEKALVERRNGAEHILAALGRHYDFLKGVLRPPPVGAFADALAAMKETKAASMLASHLADPADTSKDMRRVAAALLTIGSADQLPELRMFFSLHRTGIDDADGADALADVARALIKFGGPLERKLVEEAARDPFTVSALRPALNELVPASEPSSG